MRSTCGRRSTGTQPWATKTRSTSSVSSEARFSAARSCTPARFRPSTTRHFVSFRRSAQRSSSSASISSRCRSSADSEWAPTRVRGTGMASTGGSSGESSTIVGVVAVAVDGLDDPAARRDQLLLRARHDIEPQAMAAQLVEIREGEFAPAPHILDPLQQGRLPVLGIEQRLPAVGVDRLDQRRHVEILAGQRGPPRGGAIRQPAQRGDGVAAGAARHRLQLLLAPAAAGSGASRRTPAASAGSSPCPRRRRRG